MRSLKALILNASLKSVGETSNTEALANEVREIYKRENVESEIVRLSDYKIAYGIGPDMGEGDEWPQIFEKVKEADILIIGTPLWLGEKSSIATLAMERLYGSSSETNDKGQAIYYNKVGGVIVTGNEDGAKHASASILYGLAHIGYVIPPNVDTYWVGEAGPVHPISMQDSIMTLRKNMQKCSPIIPFIWRGCYRKIRFLQMEICWRSDEEEEHGPQNGRVLLTSICYAL